MYHHFIPFSRSYWNRYFDDVTCGLLSTKWNHTMFWHDLIHVKLGAIRFLFSTIEMKLLIIFFINFSVVAMNRPIFFQDRSRKNCKRGALGQIYHAFEHVCLLHFEIHAALVHSKVWYKIRRHIVLNNLITSWFFFFLNSIVFQQIVSCARMHIPKITQCQSMESESLALCKIS